MARSISSFEGSNEVRHLNKSSINVAAGSSETAVDATRAFARTVPFTFEDVGYVTVDPSLMTSEKSGVTYNISESLDQRSTNLDGDPTFFAETPKAGGGSAVDVIPVVTAQANGLMNPTMLNRLNDLALIRNAAQDCDNGFFLNLSTHAGMWINGTRGEYAHFRFPVSPGDNAYNAWIAAKGDGCWHSIGNLGGNFYVTLGLDSETGNNVANRIQMSSTALSTMGTFTASRVYNAVWNDYAELFERGSKTEPGDIVMLDINTDKEQYVIAERGHGPVIGVHSDTYAQLIGGEKVPSDQNVDHAVYNMPRYIPIGLAGRVNVKVTGNIRKGQRLCLSEVPGVARAVENGFDDSYIVGIALENHDGNNVDRIKMFIKL